MILFMNQPAAKGMNLWIWMLKMHNLDSLTTICPISRKNVQHAIISIQKVILLLIIILKHKIFFFQDLHSPNINHNHHHISSTRPQGDHQVLVTHLAHAGVTITISVFQITGMHPYCHSFQYLHHSICIHLQKGPSGDKIHCTLDQRPD